MQQVRVGARDISISRLFFGTLPLGPLQRGFSPERGAELICYAAARGVDMVDTAEYYRTYPHIKEALRVVPDLKVCTKSYAYDLDGAKRSVALAQEGIGRERIDIFLLHEQESEHTLRGHREALAHYCRLREAGVIGLVGISTHHVAAVRAALLWPEIDVVFPIINNRGLGIVDGNRQDMERAITEIHTTGRGVLAMKALGGGHLIPERQAAFQYIFALESVDAVAMGMQSEPEIDFNIALFEGHEPAQSAVRETANAHRALVVQDWCEGCGKCAARCQQGALTVVEGKAAVDVERCVLCGYCGGVCPQFCLKVF